jgi:hypothetical protein
LGFCFHEWEGGEKGNKFSTTRDII